MNKGQDDFRNMTPKDFRKYIAEMLKNHPPVEPTPEQIEEFKKIDEELDRYEKTVEGSLDKIFTCVYFVGNDLNDINWALKKAFLDEDLKAIGKCRRAANFFMMRLADLVTDYINIIRERE